MRTAKIWLSDEDDGKEEDDMPAEYVIDEEDEFITDGFIGETNHESVSDVKIENVDIVR